MSLKNLATVNQKLHKVLPWHLQLERRIPYTAVYYIFMGAELHNGIMFFDTADELDRAVKYKHDVYAVMPLVTMASRTQVLPYAARQKLGADSSAEKHRG